MSDDLAHDAHLRTALRHAPDHALSPPAGLSETILAAARQAHRPQPARPAPPPPRMRPAGAPSLRTWLRRLLSPQWAGALTTALVAALGLGLWLDLELHPVIERPAVVVGSTPSEPAVAAPPAAAPDVPPRAVAPTPPQLAVAQAPRVQSPPRDVAAETKQAQPKAVAPPTERPAQAKRNGDVATAPQRESAAPAPARLDDPQSPGLRMGSVPSAESGAAATAGAESHPAADALSKAQAPTSPLPAAAARSEPAAPEGRRLRAEVDSTLREQAARSAAKVDAATLAAAAPSGASGSPASTLLRRAQGELAAGSARWTWAAPGRPTIAAFDADAQAWLSRVAQATQGRWSDAADGGEAPDAIEARWWRDGWPQATLRIEADGLRWIDHGGRVRRAALDAPTLQRLRGP